MLYYDYNIIGASPLLVPGMIPVGPVRIRQCLSHPIRYAVFPTQTHGVVGGIKEVSFKSNENTAHTYPSSAGGSRSMYFANASSDLQFNVDSTVPSSTDFTLLICITTGALAGSLEYLFSIGIGSIAIKHASISSNWGWYDGSALVSAGTTVAATTRYNLIVRRSNGGTLNFFRNGIKEAASPTSTRAVGFSWIVFNSYVANGNLGTTGHAHMMTQINGALSDGECKYLTRNPCSIFSAI